METYSFGESVRLGAASPTVNRVQVLRPDGTELVRDWDRRVVRIRADQAGIWSWQLYLRTGSVTSVEAGQFEVRPSGMERNAGVWGRRPFARLRKR